MYLRRLGFTLDNTPFASHAQYFRDALVLDNTFDSDLKDPLPLQRFMDATLFDPSTPLPPLRHPNGVTESEPGSPAQSQAPFPILHRSHRLQQPSAPIHTLATPYEPATRHRHETTDDGTAHMPGISGPCRQTRARFSMWCLRLSGISMGQFPDPAGPRTLAR